MFFWLKNSGNLYTWYNITIVTNYIVKNILIQRVFLKRKNLTEKRGDRSRIDSRTTAKCICLSLGARVLEVGDWLASAPRCAHRLHRTARLPGYPAIVGRASARIRLSLRINISLTIGEIYKMIEDFSTQFSSLYLPMKYLAIISRHPVYILF